MCSSDLTPDSAVRLIRQSDEIAGPTPIALDRSKIRAGMDTYCIEVPTFPGQMIDLKYRYNDRSPRVAYDFVKLDRSGRACLSPPADVPWGTIDLLGIRRSGTYPWASVFARLEVLP